MPVIRIHFNVTVFPFLHANTASKAWGRGKTYDIAAEAETRKTSPMRKNRRSFFIKSSRLHRLIHCDRDYTTPSSANSTTNNCTTSGRATPSPIVKDPCTFRREINSHHSRSTTTPATFTGLISVSSTPRNERAFEPTDLPQRNRPPHPRRAGEHR